MNNQECKIRSEIINVSTNEPMFYPYSITKSAKAVVILLMTHMLSYVFLTPNRNVKVFNIALRTNEARHIE